MDRDIIVENPLLKQPILAVLSVCSQKGACARKEVESEVGGIWNAKFTQSPSTVIDALVRNGAIEEQMLVDGAPYAGKLEDMMFDANVSDDAEIASLLSVTDAGRALMAAHEPELEIKNLLDTHPQYKDIFQAVLSACSADEGAFFPDMEELIESFPQTAANPETGQRQVYAQFFIDSLESAGAIEWDSAWRITPVGKEVASELNG